jgi:heat shock protein HslJ
MKSLIQLLPLVCVLFAVTACGPAQYATTRGAMIESDALYDHSWELAELNGTTIVRDGDRYSYITFTPNTNKISGYTTCNYLGGTISLSGTNGIRVSPVVTTKNSCTGNKLDASLVPALQGVDSWAVVDDDLVMYRNGNIIARWTPAKYASDDLYGNWQLTYVDDHTVPFNVLYPEDKRPTIVFTQGKNVMTGTTGFNTISCPVSISSNGITFADCESTKVACEGPGESIFMDNLKSINHYSFTDDNTLVLVTDDNKVMRFKRL